jgi:hypothetical protein
MTGIFFSSLAHDRDVGIDHDLRLHGVRHQTVPLRGALEVAAIDRDGRVEFREGAISFAARQEERQTDGHRFAASELVEHLERGEPRDRSLGELLADLSPGRCLSMVASAGRLSIGRLAAKIVDDLRDLLGHDPRELLAMCVELRDAVWLELLVLLEEVGRADTDSVATLGLESEDPQPAAAVEAIGRHPEGELVDGGLEELGHHLSSA